MRRYLISMMFLVVGCTPKNTEYRIVHGLLPMPEQKADEKIYLTVTNNSGGKNNFTLAQLQALPAISYSTIRPESTLKKTYTGVMLRDIFKYLHETPDTATVKAEDNFAAHIPSQDFNDYAAMLAYEADGYPLSYKDKGPLLLVFPNHIYPERFGAEAYGSKWVWYVRNIDLE